MFWSETAFADEIQIRKLTFKVITIKRNTFEVFFSVHKNIASLKDSFYLRSHCNSALDLNKLLQSDFFRVSVGQFL